MNKLIQLLKSWIFNQSAETKVTQGSMPAASRNFDWQYLVTLGHFNLVRMNYLKFIRVRLMITLIISIVGF